MALLDDELHALYAVRPEEFVAARNQLVRSLRKDGRLDDAASAAKVRRPSATAWALNQVARDEPQLVTALLDESARLRDAMQRAVRGDAAEVRPAQQAERRALDSVVAAARRQLQELGQADNDVAVLRLTNTLRATSLDESLADRLRNGQLDADVVLSGFGFAGMTADESIRAPAPRAKAKRPTGEGSPAARSDDAPPDAAGEAEAAARRAELQAEAKRLTATANRLASAAEKAQRQVDQLREQAARLHERLEDAERAAALATRAADAARADAARARDSAAP